MATLIQYANGNIDGATTFKAAETGTGALAMIRSTTATLAVNSTATSPTFTVTNAKVIEGVYLMMNAGSTVGATIKIQLDKGGVEQASVTVNCADLPDNNDNLSVTHGLFFKFTSTATGDGGTNWTIKLTSNAVVGAGCIYGKNSGTSGDFVRALRTSTTATAAAGDNLIICGEMTGAATHNSYTVTMNGTSVVDYGTGVVNTTSVSGGTMLIAAYGTLSYGTAAATNYILRLSGDLIIYRFGTVNIGSSGAEIPRDSTAILEFDQGASDCEFGLLVYGGTFNAAGLSRTSGKNIVQCKLTADVTSATVLNSAATATNVTATANNGVDLTGAALGVSSALDTTTNAEHIVRWSAPSISNTTQTAVFWLSRGAGTNNRYVRLTLGNNTTFASTTAGCYVDVDLQAGTVGTATAIGVGTAISASIVAQGPGFIIKLTGKVSSGSATPNVLINICSAAGTTSFAGANNIAINYGGVALVNGSSTTVTYNVDTDTGWLANDIVMIAATTTVGLETEFAGLNANAGASSFVTDNYPFGMGSGWYTQTAFNSTHHGTPALIAAEVGLITRNVKIRSTSQTFMTYAYVNYNSIFNASWTEFYNFGVGSTNKGGITFKAVGAVFASGAKTLSYCSVHSGEYAAVYVDTSVGGSYDCNVTVSNTVMCNFPTYIVYIGSNYLTVKNWTVDNCLIMLMRSNQYAVRIWEPGGTFTNNTIVGVTNSYAMEIQSAGGTRATIGTWNNITIHAGPSNAVGINIASVELAGTIENLKIYRIGRAIYSSAPDTVRDLYFKSVTFFGCATYAVDLGSMDAFNCVGSNNTICGDSSYPTPIAFQLGGGAVGCNIDFFVQDLNAAVGTGIFVAPSTSDFNMPTNGKNQHLRGFFNNCRFTAPTLFNSRTIWGNQSFMSFQRWGQTAGDHRTEMRFGQTRSDATIYHTATPSTRLTPNNASNKLVSASVGRGILAACSNGGTVAVSVYVRKSVVGDGAAYNGTQPRLIQRANAALGQTEDVVLDTMTVATGTWEQLSATSSTASGDDGAWEFIVDCDGTTGWVNIEDWVAT